MAEFDFFDLTGLPFDPPIKSPKKIKAAIDKKIKELCMSLSVSSQQVKRNEINAQINFLENISEKVFDPDEKKLNKDEYRDLISRRIDVAKKKLHAVASFMDLTCNHTISDRMVKFYCKQEKLSQEHVQEIFAGFGFVIINTDPLKAFPKFPTNVWRIHSEIFTLSKTEDPNPNGLDTSSITDLYSFAAYLGGEPEDVVSYRTKTTMELESLFEVNAKKFSMRSDNFGRLCGFISSAAKHYVFASRESRQEYDNYLKYVQLECVFEVIRMVYPRELLNPSFADYCIERIQSQFEDYETACAIYNKEAGLINTPYPQYFLATKANDMTMDGQKSLCGSAASESLCVLPNESVLRTAKNTIDVGIEWGNSCVKLSVLSKDGNPEMICNLDDETYFFDTSVYFPKDGSPFFGQSAKEHLDVEAERVVLFWSRYIGNASEWDCEIDGVKYSMAEIVSLFFADLKKRVHDIGYDLNNALLTYPAYYSGDKCLFLKRAAEEAGLCIRNFVPEPTAITLSYCCAGVCSTGWVLTLDLGATSCNVTLLDVSQGTDSKMSIYIRNCITDDRLGGIDWDARMYDYMCEKYTFENGISQDDMELELQSKIRAQVEQAKKHLSTLQKKSYTISYDGDRTRIELTRQEFEERTQDLVEQIMNIVHELLDSMALSAEAIDRVLLAGGGVKMPMIQEAIKAVFPGKVFASEPEFVAAKGALLAEKYL